MGNMKKLIKVLQKIGLTEYEAKVYLSLLSNNVSSASVLAEKAGVPRTKIYSVLRSLSLKGWVKIYSGIPLLFRALEPREVIERIRKNYDEFLKQIVKVLDKEASEMEEKYLIKKFNVGLKPLKEEIKKAKTVWINNATKELISELQDSFREDAEVKVILFPGEGKTGKEGIEFREAGVKIVCMVKNKEVPSTSIILDEERIFTVFKDPFTDRYIVDEMLYDECIRCFLEWHSLGWMQEKT